VTTTILIGAVLSCGARAEATLGHSCSGKMKKQALTGGGNRKEERRGTDRHGSKKINLKAQKPCGVTPTERQVREGVRGDFVKGFQQRNHAPSTREKRGLKI